MDILLFVTFLLMSYEKSQMSLKYNASVADSLVALLLFL